MDLIEQHVIENAKKHPQIKKVILFGSRARGDFRPESDYDFGFEIAPDPWAGWGAFCLNLEDLKPSLMKLDLIHLGECASTLREKISKEGKIIYERK